MHRLYLQTPNTGKVLVNGAKWESCFALSNKTKGNPSKEWPEHQRAEAASPCRETPLATEGNSTLPQGKKHAAKFCCNVAQTISNCHWKHLTFILLVLPPGSGKRRIILATQHQHFWKSEYSWLHANFIYQSRTGLSNFTCRLHSESYHHQIKSFKILLILIIIIENKVFY